jgi:hypothetical protein
VLRENARAQQVTLSTMQFATPPTFAEFEALCATRIAAEKVFAADASIQTERASGNNGMYAFTFSGTDNASGRVFSGLLTLKQSQLVTLYLESAGVSANDHRKTFAEFARGVAQ